MKKHILKVWLLMVMSLMAAGVWGQAPTAVSFDPVNESGEVPVDKVLNVVFNQDIRFQPDEEASRLIRIRRYDSGAIFKTYVVSGIDTDPLLSIVGSTLSISHDDLLEDTQYYVTIENGAIESLTGEAYIGFTNKDIWKFTTEVAPIPLGVVSFDPVNESGEVPVDKVLNVVFNQDIRFQPDEEASRIIRIRRYDNTAIFKTYVVSGIDTDPLLSIVGSTLSISHDDLLEDTQYYVTIENGAIESLTGEAYIGFTNRDVWKFTTEPEPVISTPPTVIENGYFPAPGAVEVSRNPVLTLTFNEDIVKGSSSGYLRIYSSLTNEESFIIPRSQAVVNANVLSVSLSSITLDYNTGYYVLIDPAYVKSVATGADFPGISNATEWTFTTESAPPAWADGYPNISNQTVANFQLDVWADVTGAFYGVLTQSSTQPTSEQIAQGQNSVGSTARIAFNQVVNSIETFSSIGVDFNDQTLLGQSYFLHLVYRSGGTYPKYGEIKTIEIDRIIPTVEKTYPANNSMVFPAPDAIEITFSELVVGTNGEALSDTYFSLVQNSDPEVPIPFVISIVADGERTVITLTPTGGLVDNTAYTLTIKTVYDLSGNPSAASTISFETDGVAQWTGSSSSSWTDAANWGETLPVDGKSVLIPGGLNNYPLINSETINVHNLTIAPGAVLSHSGGTLNVNGLFHLQSSSDVNASYINTGGILNALADSIRVDQVISNPNVTYHISSPVIGATPYSISATQGMYFFNNASGMYENHYNNTMMTGVGYTTRSNTNLDFRGNLNLIDFELPVYRSTKGFGWNLIGNPYTAMLDFSQMINDDIESTFWLWQNQSGIYGTMNFQSGIFINLETTFIPSNHSFFVKVKQGVETASLSFSTDYLSANTTTYLKSGTVSQVEQVKLAGVSGSIEDEMALGFISRATQGIDKYDSEKFLGRSANVLELYSLVGNNKLAINSLPLSEVTTIPLGYSVSKSGDYSIKLKGNYSNTRLFLTDDKVNQTVELLNGDEYAFAVSAPGIDNTRFSLQIERVLTGDFNEIIKVDNLRVSVINQNVHVFITSSMLNSEYSVVDMTGRVVINDYFTNEGLVNIGRLHKGTYVIQAINKANQGQWRQKIVVY